MIREKSNSSSEKNGKTEHPHLPTIAPPAEEAAPEVKHGFLPIETNTFDRFFISGVCLVAIHLLWLRFLEASLPLWIATVVSIILGVIIVRYG